MVFHNLSKKDPPEYRRLPDGNTSRPDVLIVRRNHPWRCLCLGFSQITITLPLRLMILHFSQIGFTDALTFMIPSYILF